MIVLDEQLLGYGLETSVGKWYRGAITDITRLRPGTVIKDEAIPALLRTVRLPTFVTINVADFWRRIEPDPAFMIACFTLPDSRAEEVAVLLRRLMRLDPFRTRRRRTGKVVRISERDVRYYSVDSKSVRRLHW